jgi:hypothetical protein
VNEGSNTTVSGHLNMNDTSLKIKGESFSTCKVDEIAS